MAPEYKSGPMEPNMRETGAKTKPMERASSGTLTAMSMKASGKRTKPTVLEYTLTSMVPSMRVTGVTICRMDRELNHGLMDPDTREDIKRA